jgi:bifunctional non-homologous end joining protein LigD
LAFSREIERRAPGLATSKWWKEERHGVFLDYNQNAKDRTTCSAYSVRPLPDARVSAPLAWAEVATCNPADFTLFTMPARFVAIGDPHAGMNDAPGSLAPLLERAARDDAAGLGDAPWPPHYRKMEGEGPRVAPSRARSASKSRANVKPDATAAEGDSPPAPGRKSKMPLIVVANALSKEAALAGLERWKARHPAAAAHLAVDDVLVDGMRGRSSVWYRIRLNLRHVPEGERPPQETPDPDDDPTREWRAHMRQAKAPAKG